VYTGDGGCMLILDVGIFLPVCKASHATRRYIMCLRIEKKRRENTRIIVISYNYGFYKECAVDYKINTDSQVYVDARV
jgi:hypothetical protein